MAQKVTVSDESRDHFLTHRRQGESLTFLKVVKSSLSGYEKGV